VIAHWDDVRVVRREEGHIRGDWQSLTGDESVTIGVKRIRVPAGSWSTPLHLEGSEEEIFYVLGGSGVSVQWEGEGDHLGYEVRAGDCLLHLALESCHTLRARSGLRKGARRALQEIGGAAAGDITSRSSIRQCYRRAGRAIVRLLYKGGPRAEG